MPSTDTVSQSLSKLSISTSSKKTRKEPLADSWEDELDNSDSDPDTEIEESSKATRKTTESSEPGTQAPPPTPASPRGLFSHDDEADFSHFNERVPIRGRGGDGSGSTTPTRRPEKSTAVAARLIAGGLGIKAPKRTEEQKAFEKAERENAIKRRNQEKEEEKRKKEADERAKRSVWDD